MVFIDKIVILVQFLIGNPFVFFNICGGTAGLCTVCAVLGTVAAAGIGQNMDADVISFIFSPEFFSTGDQIIQLWPVCESVSGKTDSKQACKVQ